MGKGGKTYESRELSNKVRTRALDDLYLVLTDSPKVGAWSEYKRHILGRLAPSLLPRLSEVSGENGGPIQVAGVEIDVRD